MKYFICGYHTVIQCLKEKKREIYKIYIQKENAIDFKLVKKKIEIVNGAFFKKKFGSFGVSHQGIAAEVGGFKKLDLKKNIVDKKLNKLICLDGLTDNRNIGSIIRSAIAFDYNGLIISDRNFDEKNIALNKTASGGLDIINLFTMSNIKYGINLLKDFNYQIIALSEKSNNTIDHFPINKNHVLILGSEGEGIKQSILKLSDSIFKIKINEKIGSLNVSNAATAAMAIINSSN
jgi:23S rRNA (guanosine2251-2'-O)-methyltransferase